MVNTKEFIKYGKELDLKERVIKEVNEFIIHNRRPPLLQAAG